MSILIKYQKFTYNYMVSNISKEKLGYIANIKTG